MIRCIGPVGGGSCPRAVDPVRGGAWCTLHTPVDLTRGVTPDQTSDTRADYRVRVWSPRRRGGV